MSKKQLNEATRLMQQFIGMQKPNGIKNTHFEHYEKLPDGKTYGIIREGSFYFIKHSERPFKDSERYAYYGGSENRHRYAQGSLSEAIKFLDGLSANISKKQLQETKFVIKKK